MAMRERSTLFDEILDFLSSAPTPEQIIAFAPSPELQQRASELLDKQRAGSMTLSDQIELDDIARMNHLMSMLKIRARAKT